MTQTAIRGRAPAHATTAAPALVMDHLSVRRGRRRVLDDISATIPAGTITGLIGPNGAGKTTLLQTIIGTLKPSSGKLSRPSSRRGATGYVPQRADVAWDFPITVSQAVLNGRAMLMGLRPAGVADYRAVETALQRAHLSELADRPIGELSGGQRQRVLIARALSTTPDVVLLDEPLTGLDVPNQQRLTDLVVQLAQEGTTVIMATHDLGQSVDTCDSLMLLRGRLIAHDSPAALAQTRAWHDTFDAAPGSALLRTVGAASC